uniref:SH3 domain-containing protein n=1 Tax=Timema poppense TaxID=170557 RepID=A0A7R9DCD1_TIMPO|nr:unnamed protein product [Timema poppensis]
MAHATHSTRLEMLTRDNYDTWKIQAEALLIKKLYMEEVISRQHEGGGFNEEESSQKDVEISLNALEDDEPIHEFKVNDYSMLDIGERQAHQGATGTESDMLAERGPGRPKLMRTERRGRPTKIYQPAANRSKKISLDDVVRPTVQTSWRAGTSVDDRAVRALYDFNGESGTAELTITAGDILTVTRQDVGEGWWEGVNSLGQTGLFPAAYVEGKARHNNVGISSIRAHAKGKKHVDRVKADSGSKNILDLVPTVSSVGLHEDVHFSANDHEVVLKPETRPSCSIQSFLVKDEVARAEILWAINQKQKRGSGHVDSEVLKTAERPLFFRKARVPGVSLE